VGFLYRPPLPATLSDFWRMKDKVYLSLGVLLLLFYGLVLAAGFSYAAGYPSYHPEWLPIFAGACAPVALIPGLLLIFVGMRARKRGQELVEFSSWVKAYRRIPLADLARKLGKSEFESEKILAQVVDRGLVHGFVDRATSEFVLQETIGQEQMVTRCPHCGATLQQRYLLGETVRCPYCNSVILEGRGAPPMPPPPPPL